MNIDDGIGKKADNRKYIEKDINNEKIDLINISKLQ